MRGMGSVAVRYLMLTVEAQRRDSSERDGVVIVYSEVDQKHISSHRLVLFIISL